jgi:hypothetical protein
VKRGVPVLKEQVVLEIGKVCDYVISLAENGTYDLIGTALLPGQVTLR